MNIVIGIPVAPDGLVYGHTAAIASGWTHNTNNSLIIKASPSPEEGRDKIVSDMEYMVPRPTHILFLDSDVVPRKNTLHALLKLDKDIVTGAVPIFQRGFFWNVSREAEYKPIEMMELPTNPFKIEQCGFGCVLIKTSVLDKMEWPYWRSEYEPGLRTLGEDIYFCKKAKQAGFDIWCEPRVKCDHVTRSSYFSIMKSMKGNK